MDPAHGIAGHQHGVAAALRESALITERRRLAQKIERNRRHELLVGSERGAQAQRCRAGGVVGIEGDVDAVGAQPQLVDQAGAEDVGFADGEHLAMTLPGVAKTGEGAAAIQRERALGSFDAQIALIDVIAVQIVAVAEFVVEVAGPLIDIHRSDPGADDAGGAIHGCVGSRNQTQQCLGDRTTGAEHLGTLGVAERGGRKRQALALAQPFIAEEEIGGAAVNGTAEVATKLIALEGRNGIGRTASQGGAIEGVARVEKVVAQELVNLAVKIVSAGTGGDVDDGAGVAAVFRAISGIINLEFRDRIDGGLEGDLVLHHVVEVDPVDHEIDGIFARAGGVEGERALAA